MNYHHTPRPNDQHREQTDDQQHLDQWGRRQQPEASNQRIHQQSTPRQGQQSGVHGQHQHPHNQGRQGQHQEHHEQGNRGQRHPEQQGQQQSRGPQEQQPREPHHEATRRQQGQRINQTQLGRGQVQVHNQGRQSGYQQSQQSQRSQQTGQGRPPTSGAESGYGSQQREYGTHPNHEQIERSRTKHDQQSRARQRTDRSHHTSRHG